MTKTTPARGTEGEAKVELFGWPEGIEGHTAGDPFANEIDAHEYAEERASETDYQAGAPAWGWVEFTVLPASP